MLSDFSGHPHRHNLKNRNGDFITEREAYLALKNKDKDSLEIWN